MLLRLSCVLKMSGKCQRIVLEIGRYLSTEKNIINYIFNNIFDSWCRTIQNKALVEIRGLCCFRG